MKYGDMIHIANTIRGYYGLEIFHEEDEIVKTWLEKNAFRCLAVILLDAMGTSILERHCSPDGFFCRNMKASISAVFPPTTTASTTSFLTGRFPCETGWLGWYQYFSEADDEIIPFRSIGYYSGVHYPDYARTTMPVTYLADELRDHGIEAAGIWPTWGYENKVKTFDELIAKTEELSHEKRFIYAYWENPDELMHQVGPYDEKVGEMVREFETKIEALAERLDSDTGLLVIADHSQVPVETVDLSMEKDLADCLYRRPSLEGRAMTFFVKEECRQTFARLFTERYGDRFNLMSHEEVMETKLFGIGKPHERFEEFIGDYLAVAIANTQFVFAKKKVTMGNHAGGMEEEAMVPLILYPYI